MLLTTMSPELVKNIEKAVLKRYDIETQLKFSVPFYCPSNLLGRWAHNLQRGTTVPAVVAWGE